MTAARKTTLAAAALATVAIAGYANSFSGVLVFDDLPSIRDNPTLRHLADVLRPPPGMTVDARPVLNVSLALNYAWSGLGTGSYHAVNLLIHILAGLTLYGIVRRSLVRFRGASADGLRPASANGLTPKAFALAAAALWLVHPLQTEAVTYIVQRAESLMGLFYLLTLYFFIRYTGIDAEKDCCPASAGQLVERLASRRLRRRPSYGPNKRLGGEPLHQALTRQDKRLGGEPLHQALTRQDKRLGTSRSTYFAVGSILSCLLGMATKEVMASAPLMVLVYDGIFVSGGYREAWRRHGRLHAALFSTWAILLLLALSSPGRGGSTGFGSGIGWGAYLATQFPSMLHYLRLAVWPAPLVFDYGPQLPPAPLALVASAAAVLALFAASLFGVWKKSPWGFLGLWFFAILSPSSLVPGMLQMTSEHRMYLPLAAVAIAAVAGLERLGGLMPSRRWVLVFPAMVLALALATLARNRVYGSELSLWTDTTAKRPENPFALVDLGVAESQAGRKQAAIADFRRAIQLRPGYSPAHSNLAGLLLQAGRLAEGRAELATALRLDPKNVVANYEMGTVLAGEGDWAGAAGHFAAQVRSSPDDAGARFRLGEALLRSGQAEAAAVAYEAGLRLQPGDANAHNDCGVALLRIGDIAGARRQFEAALRLKPGDSDAQRNLSAITP